MTTSSGSENLLRAEVSRAHMDNTAFPGRRITLTMRRPAPATNLTGWKKPQKYTRESTCPGRGRHPMSWTLAAP